MIEKYSEKFAIIPWLSGHRMIVFYCLHQKYDCSPLIHITTASRLYIYMMQLICTWCSISVKNTFCVMRKPKHSTFEAVRAVAATERWTTNFFFTFKVLKMEKSLVESCHEVACENTLTCMDWICWRINMRQY